MYTVCTVNYVFNAGDTFAMRGRTCVERSTGRELNTSRVLEVLFTDGDVGRGCRGCVAIVP